MDSTQFKNMMVADVGVKGKGEESQVKKTNSPITKKLMIESQSGNGKCYLRLISMLPNFKHCSLKDLEHCIVYMTKQLGSKPEGRALLPELFIVNEMLDGDLDFPNRADFDYLDAQHLTQNLVSSIMDSGVRFMWEEMDGVHHIGGYIETGMKQKEVYTEQGYSARFVLCMVINPGVRVGSEFKFADLFDQMENAEDEVEEVQHFPFNRPNKPANINTNINMSNFHDSGVSSGGEEMKAQYNDRLREVEALNKQVKLLEKKIQESAYHQRSPEVDELTIKRFSDLFEKQTRLRQKTPKTEVFPEDSSSNIGRYKNDYLEDGTIYNVEGDGQTVLQTTRAHHSLRPEKQIVVGYKKTNDMLIKENNIYKRVNSINGLANPFHSHRLNFLCHFDTAIRSIQIRKENYTHYDTILWISKHKSQSPSQELLYQVVINTFDLEHESIVSNPYKLPFLEVGMLLSDDCLVKCFNLIRLEFKTLWFEKMKGLLVPTFHDEFITHKEHKLTSNRDKDKIKEVKEVRFNNPNGSGPRRKGGRSSILSFITE